MKKIYTTILLIALFIALLGCEEVNSTDIENKIRTCKEETKEAHDTTINLLKGRKKYAITIADDNYIDALIRSTEKSKRRGIKYCEIFIKN